MEYFKLLSLGNQLFKTELSCNRNELTCKQIMSRCQTLQSKRSRDGELNGNCINVKNHRSCLGSGFWQGCPQAFFCFLLLHFSPILPLTVFLRSSSINWTLTCKETTILIDHENYMYILYNLFKMISKRTLQFKIFFSHFKNILGLYLIGFHRTYNRKKFSWQLSFLKPVFHFTNYTIYRIKAAAFSPNN